MSSVTNLIPIGLRQAIQSGNCVLFIGAGVGSNMKAPDGSDAPDAKALATEMAAHFNLDTEGDFDLAKVSEVVQLTNGHLELIAFLKKRLADLQPDDTMKWLFSIRWRAIYTTNYDATILRCYELNPDPIQTPVVISSTAEFTRCDFRFEIPIYHLHGSLFSTARSNVIITESDYIKFREKRRMLFNMLQQDFATSNILYIGYSNRDPNWKTILSELSAEFDSTPMPPSYRVTPTTLKLDRELLKAKNIHTIDATLSQFVDALKIEIPPGNISKDQWKAIEKSIPTDFHECYSSNPAPVARLLVSWEYVNQAPFDLSSNVRNFLRGDRPNWGLIASGHSFCRDLESPVFDELLDYATSDTRTPRVVILLAPAGYGVSTFLMTSAARLVKERAGAVFMLRPGQEVLEGDILYAASVFNQRNFFFVDNAADHEGSIREAIGRLRDSGKSALFILGARLNEWRQILPFVRGKEFVMSSLSDSEIGKLIECLRSHGELGVLTTLSDDHKFAVIKEKNKKELLVTMREATEGKSFDAILEDEFRRIGDELSRKLYLTVCCFSQHGAFVRDALLANLLGLDVVQMYSKIKSATEGVVVFEILNLATGVQGARARHRSIAAIVWERCGERTEKDAIIQASLNGLNLNYGYDKEAFEQFVRSDRLVDSISSLEGKLRFFDKAVSKDPSSPYVRQHYARMLCREERFDMALHQIEEGIKLGPKTRVLFHTKGLILAEMAISAESLDIGRRRLAQSEASFRKTIAMFSKDEYGYQGLARLYINWSQRDVIEDEKTEYLTKAEEVIQEGMRAVKSKETLWIESAKIQEVIGNDKGRTASLEKAIIENPSSIIARYLLGRSYRLAKRSVEALKILDPIILSYHDEFRPFMEYAKGMLATGKNPEAALAVLTQSTLYGLSDSRFVALYGGLQFLSGKFTDAQKTFDDAEKKGFDWLELKRVEFTACDDYQEQIPTRFHGRVKAVKAGYSWVESSGFPDIICPYPNYSGIEMVVNQRISFEMSFTPRGAIVENPMVE